jgi:hypothetical protein
MVQGWAGLIGPAVRRPVLAPGNVTVDLWPDMTEAKPAERFTTGFKLANGTPAVVFSSHNRTTVLRYFKWMREYGIDGAFVQQFGESVSATAGNTRSGKVVSLSSLSKPTAAPSCSAFPPDGRNAIATPYPIPRSTTC